MHYAPLISTRMVLAVMYCVSILVHSQIMCMTVVPKSMSVDTKYVSEIGKYIITDVTTLIRLKVLFTFKSTCREYTVMTAL